MNVSCYVKDEILVHDLQFIVIKFILFWYYSFKNLIDKHLYNGPKIDTKKF